MSSHRTIAVLMFVVFAATTGYGVSFPLLAISLEAKGFSSALIGLNAAMPALGWIVASLLIPRLHIHYGTRSLMIAFLVISIVGLAGFAFVNNFIFWLFCRFLFGGGLGMFFRTIEYHLNSMVSKEERGKILGIYITCFLCGIVLGSVIQPIFAIDTLPPYAFIFLCLMVSAVCLFGSGFKKHAELQPSFESFSSSTKIRDLFLLVPVAATGVLVYGLLESIPAYLMPIYALKVGFDEASAAYT